jgi:hypothetical protein
VEQSRGVSNAFTTTGTSSLCNSKIDGRCSPLVVFVGYAELSEGLHIMSYLCRLSSRHSQFSVWVARAPSFDAFFCAFFCCCPVGWRRKEVRFGSRGESEPDNFPKSCIFRRSAVVTERWLLHPFLTLLHNEIEELLSDLNFRPTLLLFSHV